jgi:hypothetical protein
MSFTKDGQRRTYKTKYFRFLLEKEIEHIRFYDSPIPYSFIRLTNDELKQLEVFGLIDNINYN